MPFKGKISDQETIFKSSKNETIQVDGLSDTEIEELEKSVSNEKKKIGKIKDYLKEQADGMEGASDRVIGEQQLYKDMSELQDNHLALIDEYKSLIKSLRSANEYKVSGRIDRTRKDLAASLLTAAQLNFTTNLLSRDLAVWYQDYSILKEDDDLTKVAQKVIDAATEEYKASFAEIAPLKKLYD